MGSWIGVSLGAGGTQNLWIQASGLGLTPLHNRHRRHCWWVFFFDVVKKASWWYPECCNLLSGTLNFHMTRTRIPNTKMGKFKTHTHTHNQLYLTHRPEFLLESLHARSLRHHCQWRAVLTTSSYSSSCCLTLSQISFNSYSLHAQEDSCQRKKIPEKQEKNTGKHAHSHTVGAEAHGHKEGLRRWWRGWVGERRRRRRGREDSVAAGEHSDGETTSHTKGPTSLGSWFRDGLFSRYLEWKKGRFWDPFRTL